MQIRDDIFKKHFLQSVFIAVLLLLFLSANVAYAAPPAHQKAWKVVPSPSVGTSDQLKGVAAISAADVWAVGGYVNSSGIGQTLVEHWDGSSWSIVSSPNAGSSDNILNGITAISANDIWAVGYSQSGLSTQSLIEHWDGTQWSIITIPYVEGSLLNSIAAVSANDIWAVGYAFNQGIEGTLVEYWNGSQWSMVLSPDDPYGGIDTLTGVAVVSATDIWAVGYASTVDTPWYTVTEHWDGTQWKYVDSPFIQGKNCMVLTAVAALATNNVWAVGLSNAYSVCFEYVNMATGLIDHWDGTQWTVYSQIQIPTSAITLSGIVALSPTDMWAVGSRGKDTFIDHWDGSGWHIVKSPSPRPLSDSLYGITAVVGNGLWAVGSRYNQTLTEFSNS